MSQASGIRGAADVGSNNENEGSLEGDIIIDAACTRVTATADTANNNQQSNSDNISKQPPTLQLDRPSRLTDDDEIIRIKEEARMEELRTQNPAVALALEQDQKQRATTCTHSKSSSHRTKSTSPPTRNEKEDSHHVINGSNQGDLLLMNRIKEHERITRKNPAIRLALDSYTELPAAEPKEAAEDYHHQQQQQMEERRPERHSYNHCPSSRGAVHNEHDTSNDELMHRIKEHERVTRANPAIRLALDSYAELPPADDTETAEKGQHQQPQHETRDSHNQHHLRNGPPCKESRDNIRNDLDDELMNRIKEHERITRGNPAIRLALDSYTELPPSGGEEETPDAANSTDETKSRDTNNPRAVFVRMESSDDDTNNDWRNRMSLMDDGDIPTFQRRSRDHNMLPEPPVGENRADDDDEPPTTKKNDVSYYFGMSSEEELMKTICKRSREFASSDDNSSSGSVEAPQQYAQPNINNDNGRATVDNESIAYYSQHSKKRIAGPVQPGAFGAAPGVRPSRNASLRYSALTHESLVGTNSSEGQAMADTSQKSQKSQQQQPSRGYSSRALGAFKALMSKRNIGLVEAQPVQSMAHIDIQAEAYESPTEEAMAAKEHRRWCQLGKSYALMFVGFVAFIILVLYGAGIFSSDDDSATSATSTSAEPTWSPTMPPTYYTHHLELPAYTQQAIAEDPNSPQALAYDWIQEDILFDRYSPYRQVQRYALVTFYYATNGEAWDVNENWLSHAHHECLWHTKGLGLIGHGIEKLCDQEGNYLYLLLTKNGLSGSLPPELFLLTMLEELDIATNEIKGTIPSQIGQMKSLRDLIMDVNQLTGTVPSEVGQLSLLEHFYIHTNSFTGKIMTEVGQLTKMIDFEWAMTMTKGTIPTEIGLMTQMTALFLDQNLLEGAIPSELGQLTNLARGFSLWGQSLTGRIPTEFGRLTNADYFYLDMNSLSGPIPSELGLLESATQIYLYGNYNISGSIPSTLGQLASNLKDLVLSYTSISGSIPSELGALTSLEKLYLSVTSLTGAVPEELGNLALSGSIEQFAVNETMVTGEIPADLCDIPELHFDCSEDLCGCECACQFMSKAVWSQDQTVGQIMVRRIAFCGPS